MQIKWGNVPLERSDRPRNTLMINVLKIAPLFLFLSCSFVLNPFAGHFKGEPNELNEQISEHAKNLLNQSFKGLPAACTPDVHVHVLGTGQLGSGNWLQPDLRSFFHPIKYIKYRFFLSGGGITSFETAGPDYLKRLLALAQADARYGKIHLLAFDYHYDENGFKDLAKSTFHISNEYVFSLAQKYPNRFVPVVSIHPNKPRATQEVMKWGKKGIKYIKWLPSAQGINPALEKHDAYYAMVKKYNMTILSHAGEERAVDGEEFQKLNNPLLLRRPLNKGVKIIVAHLAGLGQCQDLDAQNHPKKDCFDLFWRLFNNPQYTKILFADLSAMTLYNRPSKPLLTILKNPQLHHRLMNGSDYPLPAINILIHTSSLEKLKYITKREKNLLNEIYSYNPLLFDFALKRTLRHPQTRQKFLDAAFLLPQELGGCQQKKAL